MIELKISIDSTVDSAKQKKDDDRSLDRAKVKGNENEWRKPVEWWDTIKLFIIEVLEEERKKGAEC